MTDHVQEYLNKLPTEKRGTFEKLYTSIAKHIPEGFKAQMQYKMPAFVVPHSRFPEGYHCNPKEPLPFIYLAAQKSHFAVYHMGLYAQPELLAWFQEECKKRMPVKLDMGKACIRFKKEEHIPFELLGELAQKMSVEEWISLYQGSVKDSRKRNKT